jgi:hypothetical protein
MLRARLVRECPDEVMRERIDRRHAEQQSEDDSGVPEWGDQAGWLRSFVHRMGPDGFLMGPDWSWKAGARLPLISVPAIFTRWPSRAAMDTGS